jgi:hypothetical protein
MTTSPLSVVPTNQLPESYRESRDRPDFADLVVGQEEAAVTAEAFEKPASENMMRTLFCCFRYMDDSIVV